MTRPWGLAIGVATVLGVWLGPVAFVVLALWLLIAFGLTGRFDARFTIVLVACVAIGALRGAGTGNSPLPATAVNSTGGIIDIDGFARPDVRGDSVQAIVGEFMVDGLPVDGDGVHVLILMPPGTTVVRGERLLITGWDVQPLEGFSPGYAQYLRGQGVAGRAEIHSFEVIEPGPVVFRWFADLRREVSSRLMEAIPGDAGALASGIVTGDDSALSEQATRAFLDTGTSHITAVSGSNVAMVLALWSVVIPVGRQRRRMLFQLAIVGSVVAYAIFVGLEPPVTRASIVAAGALLAGRVGRVPDVMTLLGLSAAVLALANPLNVHLASYWLSIVASVAIAIRMPVVGSADAKRAFRSLLEGVVIAQVATMPLVLAWFGTWSPSSVMANILLAPLMWAAFPLCFLLAVVIMVLPPLAPFLTLPSALLLEISLRVVHVLAEALPPVTVGEAGPAAYLAVTVPCVVIVLLMAGESHRWWPVIADRRRDQPVMTLLAVTAPLIGILIGALVAVVMW
jgi:ComEC/Rec2-related protein